MNLSEEHLEKIEKEAKMFCQQNGIKYPKSFYPGTKIVVKHLIKFILSDPELLSKAGWVKKEEWISVSERLPEFGVNVLVRGEARGMNPQMGGAYTFICSRKNLKGTSLEKQSERYIEKNQFAASYVTHWQPLPSPPQNK